MQGDPAVTGALFRFLTSLWSVGSDEIRRLAEANSESLPGLPLMALGQIVGVNSAAVHEVASTRLERVGRGYFQTSDAASGWEPVFWASWTEVVVIFHLLPSCPLTRPEEREKVAALHSLAVEAVDAVKEHSVPGEVVNGLMEELMQSIIHPSGQSTVPPPTLVS